MTIASTSASLPGGAVSGAAAAGQPAYAGPLAVPGSSGGPATVAGAAEGVAAVEQGVAVLDKPPGVIAGDVNKQLGIWW